GETHFSIVADPTDPNVVFVGGDRQPGPDKDHPEAVFPNAAGADDFTGRLFRGNADGASPDGIDEDHDGLIDEADEHWGVVTDKGASGTGPHADSRTMVFDAAGNILEGDDGGIYRLRLAAMRPGTGLIFANTNPPTITRLDGTGSWIA